MWTNRRRFGSFSTNQNCVKYYFVLLYKIDKIKQELKEVFFVVLDRFEALILVSRHLGIR